MKKFEVRLIDDALIVEAFHFDIDGIGMLRFYAEDNTVIAAAAPNCWVTVREVNTKAASAQG